MRLRDFRPWSAGSAVCLVLLGCTAGICLAQAPKSEKPAAKADAKKPSIYDKNDDAKVQLAVASTRAERSNKRVLLMFGGDWSAGATSCMTCSPRTPRSAGCSRTNTNS